MEAIRSDGSFFELPDSSRRQLRKIFFHSEDPANSTRSLKQDGRRLSSGEQEEFWHFSYKFLSKRQKKPPSSKKGDEDYEKKLLALERRYNFSVASYLSVYEKDSDSYPHVTPALIRIVHEAYLFFLDFLDRTREREKHAITANRALLPIYAHRNEIISAVRNNSVTIVSGDTGCGKSTQVPQYLHEAGFSRIACTQPRRIACISLAHRVAAESGKVYGRQVGYQIRFERAAASGNCTDGTEILFLTEGVLVKQLSPRLGDGNMRKQFDQLQKYDLVILDEVHERHLVADFLLALLQQIVQQRHTAKKNDESHPKIVLMSATINIDLFATYFPHAPVISVPGRLFPIELFYRPTAEKNLQGPGEKRTNNSAEKNAIIDPGPYIRILQMIDKKYGAVAAAAGTNDAGAGSDGNFVVKSGDVGRFEPGDALIFLSGSTEIDIVVGAARHYAEKTRSWIALPLHSALTADEQQRVFARAPHGMRKCIVSTNIAETSVTIDGIRFVIDSGKAKEMAFDPSTRLQRLKEKWISKASAEQRRGRAGRTGPGVCYRLYEESDFDNMQPYNVPEIRRVPLENLLLEMLTMGLPLPKKVVAFEVEADDEKSESDGAETQTDDGNEFHFIEAPDTAAMRAALSSLVSHRAVSLTERATEKQAVLTPLGALLAQLPVEVQIGKCLIFGTLVSAMYLNADDVAEDSRSSRLRAGTTALVAILSTQSMLTQRALRDRDCRAKLETAVSEHGDMLTLLNVYEQWLHMKSSSDSNHHTGGHSSSGDASRKWCNRRGINEQRLYEVSKLRWQFSKLITACMKRIIRLQPRVESRRHGYRESSKRKQLLSLRDKARHQRLNRQPKVLKPEFDADTTTTTSAAALDADEETGKDTDVDVDGDETDFNLDDIEFQMRSGSSSLTNDILPTHRDELRMLHFAIAMALYPNFAVADELNTLKSDSEQIYHTRSKLFLLMHPSSVFALRPQLVQLMSSDDVKHFATEAANRENTSLFECEPNERQRRLRRMWNTSHSIIIYERVLETRKPYLLNCARAPLLHTCLLCCAQVDVMAVGTNEWRVIFDRWLSAHILSQQHQPNDDTNDRNRCDEDAVPLFFGRALRLRLLWSLIQRNLTAANLVSGVDSGAAERSEITMLRHFRHQVLIFMDTQILYAVKVLPAEVKVLYKDSSAESAPHADESQAVNEAGFTYNILSPTFTSECANDFGGEKSAEVYLTTLVCPYCKDALHQISVCGTIQHCSHCGLEHHFVEDAAVSKPVVVEQNVAVRKQELPNESGSISMADINPSTNLAESSCVCDACGEKLPAEASVTQMLKHRKTCIAKNKTE